MHNPACSTILSTFAKKGKKIKCTNRKQFLPENTSILSSETILYFLSHNERPES